MAVAVAATRKSAESRSIRFTPGLSRHERLSGEVAIIRQPSGVYNRRSALPVFEFERHEASYLSHGIWPAGGRQDEAPEPRQRRVCRRRERPGRRSADTIRGLVNLETADIRYIANSA